MIRTVLRAGGILILWVLASALVVAMVPWAGALFALVLSVLPLGLHVWLPKRRGRTKMLTALGAHPLPGARNWILAALFSTPAMAISLAVVSLQLLPVPEAAQDLFTTYEENGGWLAIAILTVFFAPIIEEFAFRGWIQSVLQERFSPAGAIIVAAVLFALLHGSVELLPVLFGIGCLFGWAVWQSGSIWAGILLHGAYNLTLMLASAIPDEGFEFLSSGFEMSSLDLALFFAVMIGATGCIIRVGSRAGGGGVSGPQALAAERAAS